MVRAGCVFVAGIHMNVRIFWVRAMKYMCAQTRPRFILSTERVLGGMEFEPMLTPREKSPLLENVPRGGLNPRRCGQRAQTLPTSYSTVYNFCLFLSAFTTIFKFFPWPQDLQTCHGRGHDGCMVSQKPTCKSEWSQINPGNILYEVSCHKTLRAMPFAEIKMKTKTKPNQPNKQTTTTTKTKKKTSAMEGKCSLITFITKHVKRIHSKKIKCFLKRSRFAILTGFLHSQLPYITITNDELLHSIRNFTTEWLQKFWIPCNLVPLSEHEGHSNWSKLSSLASYQVYFTLKKKT